MGLPARSSATNVTQGVQSKPLPPSASAEPCWMSCARATGCPRSSCWFSPERHRTRRASAGTKSWGAAPWSQKCRRHGALPSEYQSLLGIQTGTGVPGRHDPRQRRRRWFSGPSRCRQRCRPRRTTARPPAPHLFFIQAIQSLPEREQHIMGMYYEHDMNLKKLSKSATPRSCARRYCRLPASRKNAQPLSRVVCLGGWRFTGAPVRTPLRTCVNFQLADR